MNIHSLRFKLIVYFLILICFPLLVVSFFAYRSSTAIIEDKVSKSVTSSQLMVEKSIETVLQQSRYAVTPFLVSYAHSDFCKKRLT
ncbi:hypothetical protein SD70_22850 [Gordoniibacillus kamchatkensis]|uniref:Uncharacterized protein n=1 Tax=Gordoniibacillus kamchatkensis TaxID=1590651 RepID=A0ABR5AD61_9BACL|nr:hypothetical protein [Paenibacillus sp. VKM B-2647]KIL38985.1 hypothetical protein SD70_22850 [Paenibacillus sp. VKM B-2647]